MVAAPAVVSLHRRINPVTLFASLKRQHPWKDPNAGWGDTGGRINCGQPYAAAHAPVISPFKESVHSLPRRFEYFQRISALEGPELISFVHQLADTPPHRGAADPVLLRRLSNRIREVADTLRASDILVVLNTFSFLNYSDENLAFVALGNLDILNSRSTASRVAQLSQLWQKLGFCADVLTRPLLEAVIQHLNSMNWDHLVQVLHGLSRGVGYQISPSARGPVFGMVLDLLTYRAKLLMEMSFAESTDMHHWRIGEVAHAVSGLEPALVYRLLRSLLKCTSPLVQSEPGMEGEAKFIALCPKDTFKALYNDILFAEAIQSLPVRELLYLLSGCQRACVISPVIQALRQRILQLCTQAIGPDISDRRLADVLFHFNASGLYCTRLARFCGDRIMASLPVAFSSSIEAKRFQVFFTLRALSTTTYTRWENFVPHLLKPSFMQTLSELSIEPLVQLLETLCLVHFKNLLPSTTSVVVLERIWIALLKEIQFCHPQLSLKERRQVQVCLAYIYLALPLNSSVQEYAFDLARNISRQPKLETALHATASASEALESPSAELRFHEYFTVSPSCSCMPLCPRNLQFQVWDVTQIGPFPVFRSTTDPRQYLTYVTVFDHRAKLGSKTQNSTQPISSPLIARSGIPVSPYRDETSFNLYVLEKLLQKSFANDATLLVRTLHVVRSTTQGTRSAEITSQPKL